MRTFRTLAAIAAASIALSACGSSASTPAAVKPAAAKPLTCRQQYDTWSHGPARAPVKKLEAGLSATVRAASATDIPLMTAGLKKAAAGARAGARYPMPKCADPKGYFPRFLARIRAAGDNAGSSSGLGSLLLAGASLKGLKKIERKLGAELKRTGAR
jgi:hypothetical protein